MRIVILPSADDVAEYGAAVFIRQLTNKPQSVLGLATGSTPLALYQLLVSACRRQHVSFARARTFNLDEYLGLAGDHPRSYRYFMQQHLFNAIDILPQNTAVPDGTANDPVTACLQYEQQIADAGGIDLQLLGLGRNGHIGFNEPASSLGSRTRIKALTQATITDNARFFQAGEYQPHLALTMGIGTILDAHKVLLLATGTHKARAAKAMIEGPLSAACPASALQLHPQTTVVLDEAAATELTDVEFYRHIERENQALVKRLSSQ
ncbi:glucosamine-6-phosphate deaminase [Arsukibacterium sp.]|uniref:glucosamine-6-phosphate deaminase n=1 Tax=Arsukibacterium sp. TaxID=1977258 RepID=UPI00299D02E5|nr:glucosamine-6-phosphate deaminase [Arsukibacterium sp.]MDX1676703.1 glucosamine-6-phosphate deaminase [Arsukibacterium sp.]